MELVSFQVNGLFKEVAMGGVMNKLIAQSRGLVKYRWDLTPIVTIDRRVRLPLSQGERAWSRLLFLATAIPTKNPKPNDFGFL